MAALAAAKGLARRRQNVDQRPFADVETKHVAHQARQPLEADVLGEAEIDDEGAQVGAEGRAGLQSRRRLGLEAPGATGTHASMQPDAHDVGDNRRNLDSVIGLARLLGALRDVGPAMSANARHDVALLRRVRMQRPVRPRMRLLLAPALHELGRFLVALARWETRVVRRLRRTIQPRPQLGDLLRLPLNLLRLPLDCLRLRQGDA